VIESLSSLNEQNKKEIHISSISNQNTANDSRLVPIDERR
jgi:hypothetical protein